MKLTKQPKVLVANIENWDFTVMIDIPYVLLPDLLQCKNLDITFKKIEDISVEEVLENPFVPIWTKQQKGEGEGLINQVISKQADEIWKTTLLAEWGNDVDGKNGELIDLGIHKQQANLLLTPFAYTTCIISNRGDFFDKFCPIYDYNGVIFYSWNSLIKGVSFECDLKVEHPMIYEMNLDAAKRKELNTSNAKPELQYIAELIYDLYDTANWKRSELNIPFEDEIDNFITNSGYYRLLTDVDTSWQEGEKPIWINQNGEEVDLLEEKIRISDYLCKQFVYSINDVPVEDLIDK